MKSQELPSFWAWIAGVLLISAWLIRTQYGIDFTDEAWYTATAYRFILGDKPYLDELFLMQGAALLTAPLYWPYVVFTGGTEGIIWYGRILFLVFHSLVGLGIFFNLKKLFPAWTAFLIGLAYFSFIPFSLIALSYNTLGLGFLVTGLCLAARAQKEHKLLYWVLAGAAHGLAVVGHPTLLPVLCAYTAILFFTLYREKEGLKWLASYLVSALVLTISVFGLAGATPELLVHNYQLTRTLNIKAGNSLDFAKAFSVLKGFFYEVIAKPLSWALIIGFLFLNSKSKKWAAILGAWMIIPVTFLNCRSSAGGGGLHMMPLTIFFLVTLFLLISRYKDFKEILPHLILPPVIAGSLISITSYNGVGNAGVSGLLGALVLLACFSLWVKKETKNTWIAVIPLLMTAVLFTYTGVRTMYQEDPLPTLTEKISQGPFKGLYTTPEKAAFEGRIFQAVSKRENLNGRVAFFSHFPAGYLMTKMKPGFPTLWGCLSVPPQICTDYYLSHKNTGDIVVRLNRLFYTRDNIVPHRYHMGPIDESVFQPALKVVETQEDFVVYN